MAALPTQHWKKLPRQSFTTVTNTLDPVYNAYQSLTYYDGAARVIGAGSAWTVSRFQLLGVTQSVYGTPPSASVSDLRFILSRSAAAAAPAMLAPDTFTINAQNIGVSKNSGAFTAWDAALPFGVGSNFSGYADFANSLAGAATRSFVDCYECEEAIAINYIFRGTTNNFYLMLVGALWDNNSATPPAAETNGRIYGMIKSSHLPSASFNTLTEDFMNYDAVGAKTSRAVYFTPGAATVPPVARGPLNASTQATGRLPDTVTLTQDPIGAYAYTLSPNPTIGTMRNVGFTSDAALSTVIQSSGGTDLGYTVAAEDFSIIDAIVLGTGA